MKKKEQKSTEWIFQFWAWQLLFWALYRYFFKLPEWADEFLFKPLVFIAPVLWYAVKKEHVSFASVGLTTKYFWRNVAIGFAVGALFIAEGLIANIYKYGRITIQPIAAIASYGFASLLIISLATAFSEELLSRGFFFSRLYRETKKIWYSIILSTLMFLAFHIPILVTTLKFQGTTLILYFFMTLFLGVTNCIFFFLTKSLVVPILVHLFWNITVALLL